MISPGERWLSDASAGDWIRVDEPSRAPDTVANLVPRTFEAFARVLHPLHVEGRDLRWGDLADRVGWALAPQTRWGDLVAEAVGRPPGNWVCQGQTGLGWLPRDELLALMEVLTRHTTSDSLVVGFWVGWGIDELWPEGAGELVLGRSGQYALAEIPLRGLAGSQLLSHGVMPNLVWPADRAWFLHTELEEMSSSLGASEAAIRDVLGSPLLEAMRATPEDPP